MNAGARHAAVRRSSSRFTARATILTVIVSALLMAAIFPVRGILSQRSQIADLTRQTGRLEAQNQRLAEKIKRYQDPEYLERKARECLGMVRPGEVSFVLVPKQGATKPASC